MHHKIIFIISICTACNETANLINSRYTNLTCLFEEAAGDGLEECQKKRSVSYELFLNISNIPSIG